MSKAADYFIPSSYLDQVCAQLALEKARGLVAQSYTLAEAAKAACEGAWAEYQGWVIAQLEAARDSGARS